MLAPVQFVIKPYMCRAFRAYAPLSGTQEYDIANYHTGLRYHVCEATPIVVERPLGDRIVMSVEQFNERFVYEKDGLYLPTDRWEDVKCKAVYGIMAQLVPADDGPCTIDGLYCNRPEVPHALGDFIVHKKDAPNVKWVENGLHFLTVAVPEK